MKKIKYFLFSIICLFSCSIVFAENKVIIKSITPIYDKGSSITVSEKDDIPQVKFNDKNQMVKYNVILENTTEADLTVLDVKLSTPTEEFLIYEIGEIAVDDVIKANETKEVVISLETIQTEGWGRNFEDELIATITLDGSGISLGSNSSTNTGNSDSINPDTSDSTKKIATVLCLTIGVMAIVIVLRKNNKFIRYSVLIIMLGSVITIVSAENTIVVTVKINASFKSQNVMETAMNQSEYDYSYRDYFGSNYIIENFYIRNEISEIKDYEYKFDVSEKKNGRVMAYLIRTGYKELDNGGSWWDSYPVYDLYLLADGIIYPNSDASNYFADMEHLKKIDNLEGLDTSEVTNMARMFDGTGYNSENFTLDLSDFDTSNVTDMSGMFNGTGYKSGNFTLDVSNFDTSNVTDMSEMFYFTGYNSGNFTLDLSDFDTSNVTDMSWMFSRTGFNSGNFTLDVSNFDTSNVTDMSGMFECTGYKSGNFTLDVSNFDTSNVTDMSWMFYRTGFNSGNFTLDVNNFDTSNVTDMSNMFYFTGFNSTKFNTSITIRNSNTEPYYNMLREVATKTGSQITVNYTSETSELVDNMIATKSPGANVVKGVQVD